MYNLLQGGREEASEQKTVESPNAFSVRFKNAVINEPALRRLKLSLVDKAKFAIVSLSKGDSRYVGTSALN